MTADALVVVVNEFLSERGATLISKRTLRFYTAQDVVPSPMGSPKFARYGYEHVLSLLAARALQDQGQRLDQIRVETSEIHRGRLDRIEGLVEAWLAQGFGAGRRTARVREANAEMGADAFSKLASMGSSLVRISLTPNCTIEVVDTPSLATELDRAAKELRKLADRLSASDS